MFWLKPGFNRYEIVQSVSSPKLYVLWNAAAVSGREQASMLREMSLFLLIASCMRTDCWAVGLAIRHEHLGFAAHGPRRIMLNSFCLSTTAGLL